MLVLTLLYHSYRSAKGNIKMATTDLKRKRMELANTIANITSDTTPVQLTVQVVQ